jgi:hypothetical protein
LDKKDVIAVDMTADGDCSTFWTSRLQGGFPAVLKSSSVKGPNWQAQSFRVTMRARAVSSMDSPASSSGVISPSITV